MIMTTEIVATIGTGTTIMIMDTKTDAQIACYADWGMP